MDQRIAVIKWIENMIMQKGKKQDIIYEVEAKMGKFTGKNPDAQKKLLNIDNLQFTKLDRNQIAYEFTSKIDLIQFKQAEEYLKDLTHHKILRIDFNFSNKDQRASIVFDQRLQKPLETGNPEKKSQQYRGHGILIEKKRQLTNHIDIINDQLHYRISLASEKELSSSLKDIFLQINSRQDRIALIRIKETNIYEDELFEHSLSTVYQLFKNFQEKFQLVLKQIQEAKFYNPQEVIDQIFQMVLESRLPPTYELEVEIKQQSFKVDQQKIIAEKLLEVTEQLCSKINMPLRKRQGSQEFNDTPIKKIKSK